MGDTYTYVAHTCMALCVPSLLSFDPAVAAVAATTFINGLNTAQVTAAAGDDVTFTCLARGFPETTITIQLSGVNASYTIGNQTLMTEATPTNFMEVTRTVTLHSVTVLDCGAVVTCEGSNMNSDGSTHTDQAAATLLVQGEMGGRLMSLSLTSIHCMFISCSSIVFSVYRDLPILVSAVSC